MISTRDLEWAAGFLEGEGSFSSTSSIAGNTELDRKRYFHQRISAVQVNPDPLGRLKSLFGGNISLTAARGKSKEIFCWSVGGAKARGVMLTLYTLLSDRRKNQIEVALLAPKGGRPI